MKHRVSVADNVLISAQWMLLNNADVRSSKHFVQSVKTRAPTNASAESGNRAASTKYFVIKYGPPASGKGSVEPLVCSLLGIREYVDVNVDLYVQLLHGANTPPDQDSIGTNSGVRPTLFRTKFFARLRTPAWTSCGRRPVAPTRGRTPMRRRLCDGWSTITSDLPRLTGTRSCS